MGNLINRVQKQKLVYFAPKQSNSHGEKQWHAPVEYTCRWDGKNTEIIASDATMVLSRNALITEVLLEVGGIVVLGELSGISYWAEATQNLGAYEILAVSSTPDIRNRKVLYEAFC
jgi:hypothetical protein